MTLKKNISTERDEQSSAKVIFNALYRIFFCHIVVYSIVFILFVILASQQLFPLQGYLI